MSSSRREELLSLRLRTLRSFYSDQEYVWDIGCDHGLLGMSFDKGPNVKSIYFVDPSEEVIQVLKQSLEDSYITKGAIYHKKGQELKIETPSNCIFIAGMGGKEIGEIVAALLPQLTNDSLFVISPHRKILELRSQLRELPVSLVEETVVEEDQQFYQILVLRPDPYGKKVSAFGDALWESEAGERYLRHQLKTFSVHRDEASEAYVQYLKVRNSLKTGVTF